MNQIVNQEAVEKVNETLKMWAKEMASNANISDCETREGCVMEMTGPEIFQALARENDCSLRTLGNDRNWNLSAFKAGIELAAYAALMAMNEEFKNDEITWEDCFEVAEKAAQK